MKPLPELTETLAQQLATLLPDTSAANAHFQQWMEETKAPLKRWEADAIVNRARHLHKQANMKQTAQ